MSREDPTCHEGYTPPADGAVSSSAPAYTPKSSPVSASTSSTAPARASVAPQTPGPWASGFVFGERTIAKSAELADLRLREAVLREREFAADQSYDNPIQKVAYYIPFVGTVLSALDVGQSLSDAATVNGRGSKVPSAASMQGRVPADANFSPDDLAKLPYYDDGPNCSR